MGEWKMPYLLSWLVISKLHFKSRISFHCLFPLIQVVRLEKANRRLQLELKGTNEQQEVQNRQV